MQTSKVKLVLSKSDYEIIMNNLRSTKAQASFNRQEAEELTAELRQAQLVSGEELPPDVVRLNSEVTIVEEKTKKQMKLVIVTPERADIRQRRISIMSPIGTALIGYSKGSQVSWQVPAGKKVFTILDVKYPSVPKESGLVL